MDTFYKAFLSSNTSFLPASNAIWLLFCITIKNNEGMFPWFISFCPTKWQFALQKLQWTLKHIGVGISDCDYMQFKNVEMNVKIII